MTPDAILLFAAGMGTRMGALTADRPKPLIEVAGRTLLDRALDLADAAGVGRKVVNTHYLGGMIAEHLAGRADIMLSPETTLLETGGGLAAALPLLGPGPVLTLNTDAVWTGPNPLTSLSVAWDAAAMDALLLLAPKAAATGHRGSGDFDLHADGRLSRGSGYVYLGAQILVPNLLDAIPGPAFSLNAAWDRAIGRGRCSGIIHPGGWCDVGHPAAIALAETLLREAADV